MELVYARRRLAAGLILSVSIVLFGTIALGGNDSPEGTINVTVHQGDTLWGLAEVYAPNSDPRDWIYEVSQLNSIEGEIKPGDILVVPSMGE